MDKASVAVALIARNAAKTIGGCLDSIVPYVEQVVVCVDHLTTDDTAAIAAKHGAKVFMGLQVSAEHECPAHGKVMAQHFANARQVSFGKLRKDVAWRMWLDADDIVEGGEQLAPFLASLPEDVDGVWLPYHYAKAGTGGPTSTLFDRERIVRTGRPWAWQYRVHEVLTPVGCTTESLVWTRTDAVRVIHQNEGHDTEGSARRNILLLEIDLEENPEDMRAWFYLGNQYFALSEWATAVECFERAAQSDNPYQLWQGLIYLSMAYEKLGDINASKFAAFRAIDVQPQHPDPYYRLASCYMLQNDVARAEFWTRMGDRQPDPPFFVFRNPLDRSYNSHLTMGTAYANAGMISKARRELEEAAKVIPSKQILDGIAYHKKMEEDTQAAEAYILTRFRLPPDSPVTHAMLSERLPDSLWKFGRVRDIIVPNMLLKRANCKPRIIFWCGRSIEPWAPPSINKTGIGGSETAVIQIAKRFAADGWRVDVYNDCDYMEGVYDGVGYWDCRRLNEGESCDVLVSWRNPALCDIPIQRRVSVLWCHDLNRGPATRDEYRKWDIVLGVSQWHSTYLSQLYDITHSGFVPNGIELDRFTSKVKKVPFRCAYTSSPDRGLPNLLRMWKDIVANEPKAELHIAYGWDNIDKIIAMGNGQLAQFKTDTMALLEKTPRVVWRGRLPQDELAKLYQESVALLYPTSFTETFCIAAVEAMASGCVPVTSEAGALPDTIGEGGLIVKGNTYTQAWKEFYVSCAKAVLHVPNIRMPLVKKGLARAQELSWDKAFEDHWKPTVTGLLEGKKEESLVASSV